MERFVLYPIPPDVNLVGLLLFIGLIGFVCLFIYGFFVSVNNNIEPEETEPLLNTRMFDNDHLQIDDLFQLFQKPRDLTYEQFRLMMLWSCHINWSKHIIEEPETAKAFIEMGLCSSIGDFRRNLQSIKVGSRKITNIKDILSSDDFFETGADHLRWTPLKIGKKKVEICLIERDVDFPDPWFRTYDLESD